MKANAWRALVAGRPGTRFIHYHEQVRKPRSYLSMAVGSALLVLGALFTLTPGPGFVLALLGAAIVAGQSRALAHVLDRCEMRLRRAARKLCSR